MHHFVLEAIVRRHSFHQHVGSWECWETRKRQHECIYVCELCLCCDPRLVQSVKKQSFQHVQLFFAIPWQLEGTHSMQWPGSAIEVTHFCCYTCIRFNPFVSVVYSCNYYGAPNSSLIWMTGNFRPMQAVANRSEPLQAPGMLASGYTVYQAKENISP